MNPSTEQNGTTASATNGCSEAVVSTTTAAGTNQNDNPPANIFGLSNFSLGSVTVQEISSTSMMTMGTTTISATGEPTTTTTTSSVIATGAAPPTELDPQAEDPNLIFIPVVVLPEIHIPTLEEDERPLITLRAKLYRYVTDEEDDPPCQWKERGVGEIKILQHNETGAVRVLMRRDKTLKVCANHYVTTDQQLKPHMGSDKAFVWSSAADFSDGEPEPELFAIKFGTPEKAEQFREAFDEAKRLVAARKVQQAGSHEPSELSFRTAATAGSDDDDDDDQNAHDVDTDSDNEAQPDVEQEPDANDLKEVSGSGTLNGGDDADQSVSESGEAAASEVADKLAAVGIVDTDGQNQEISSSGDQAAETVPTAVADSSNTASTAF